MKDAWEKVSAEGEAKEPMHNALGIETCGTLTLRAGTVGPLWVLLGCLVSISKSKERVVVVPLAKLTQEISSKRRWTGGLCT